MPPVPLPPPPPRQDPATNPQLQPPPPSSLCVPVAAPAAHPPRPSLLVTPLPRRRPPHLYECELGHRLHALGQHLGDAVHRRAPQRHVRRVHQRQQQRQEPGGVTRRRGSRSWGAERAHCMHEVGAAQHIQRGARAAAGRQWHWSRPWTAVAFDPLPTLLLKSLQRPLPLPAPTPPPSSSSPVLCCCTWLRFHF